MNKQELQNTMREFYEHNLAISKAKNDDYCGTGDADPFANFKRAEDLGICSTEQGFLVRMTDKLCRISSFVARQELSVKDESVEDTLRDLANYAALLYAYLQDKRRTK